MYGFELLCFTSKTLIGKEVVDSPKLVWFCDLLTLHGYKASEPETGDEY